MRRLPALLLCLPLLLTACGGGSEGGDGSGEKTSRSTAGGGSLPTVEGEVGKKPTVKAPGGKAPSKLETEVLTEGEGDEVAKGDLLVAHYLGQTWRDNKVFDNSYDRGEPSGFGIGVGQVVKGWDQGLVGQKVGSRVLLVVPPDLGYGAQGNPQGGIKGDDTLVFVVDIVDSFGKDSAATGTVRDDIPAGLPEVDSEPGKKPTVKVKGVKAPAQPRSAVLIAGDGPAIDQKKNLVVQALQVDLKTGKPAFSSWESSPVPIKSDRVPGLADAIKGQNVGSRVLLALPGAKGEGDQPGQPPAAVVVDVVGMF